MAKANKTPKNATTETNRRTLSKLRRGQARVRITKLNSCAIHKNSVLLGQTNYLYSYKILSAIEALLISCLTLSELCDRWEDEPVW